MTPEESRAHARGYDEGYDEARAEFLYAAWKHRHELEDWIAGRVKKASDNGRWPEGFNKPEVN